VGIVATLIWHYTVDASLVGMLLIRSDNLYFKISGVVVGWQRSLRWRGPASLFAPRRFEPVDDLLNGAEAVPEINLARRPATEEGSYRHGGTPR